VFEYSSASGSARLVLLTIALHINPETGDAWPKVATIAKLARLSLSTTRAAIRDLERARELVTERGGGRHKSSHYRLGPKITLVGKQTNTHRPAGEFQTTKTHRSVGEFLDRKTHQTTNENPPNCTPKPTDGSVPKGIERKNESAPPAPLAAEGGCASGARVAPIEEQRDNLRKLRQRLHRRSTQHPPLRIPVPSAGQIDKAGEVAGEESVLDCPDPDGPLPDRRNDGVPPASDLV
jgi:hypothetical protein